MSGNRITDGDGTRTFETDRPYRVPAESLQTDVAEAASEAGLDSFRAAYAEAKDAGLFDRCIETWQDGGTVLDEDMDDFLALADVSSPDELFSLADEKVISMKDSEALIMAQGINVVLPKPEPLDDIKDVVDTAMAKFYSMAPEIQAFVYDQVARLQEFRDSASDQVESLRLSASDQVARLQEFRDSASDQVESLRLAASDQVARLQEFQDSASDQVESLRLSASDQVDRLRLAASDQVERLRLAASDQVEHLQEVNFRGKFVGRNIEAHLKNTLEQYAAAYLTSAYSDNLTPEQQALAKSKAEDLQNTKALWTTDIATCALLVGVSISDELNDLIAEETVNQQEGSDLYQDGIAAKAAVMQNEESNENETTDMSEVYFTDHNGDEVLVTDFCEDNGIAIPDGDEYSHDECENTITNIDTWAGVQSENNQEDYDQLEQDVEYYQQYLTQVSTIVHTIMEAEKGLTGAFPGAS